MVFIEEDLMTIIRRLSMAQSADGQRVFNGTVQLSFSEEDGHAYLSCEDPAWSAAILGYSEIQMNDSTSNRLDLLQSELKVIMQRLNLFRDSLIAIAITSLGVLVYLLLYRNTAVRDVADLRNGVMASRLEAQEAARTAGGVGSSLDQYREAQKLVAADLEGQVKVVRKIGNWFLGIATAIFIGALMAYLKL
jgi:hypothetical protein